VAATRSIPRVDVLAIAAHRDDVEQTCGGTLLALARRGATTGILDLTAGEAGTRGSAAEREREAEKAAKVLRVGWRGNAGLPDGALALRHDYKLRVASFIRQARPKIVILPYPEARHPDHAVAGRLGYAAAFVAGLKNAAGLEGDEFRPRSILYASLYANVRPTFVVDISAEFEERTRALLVYSSQYRDQAAGREIFPEAGDIRARVEALARTFGMMIGVRYGEPFVSRTPLRVGDLRELDVDTFTRGGLITPF
jgi:bacillithiol biosynthesis deacetylase BshB1